MRSVRCRKPAGLLACIKLEPASALPENTSKRELARSLVALAVEKPGHPSVRQAEAILGLAPGSLKALHHRLADQAREEDSAVMAAMRAALPKMSSASVPTIPRSRLVDHGSPETVGEGYSVAPDADHADHWWVYLPTGVRVGPYWNRISALEVARQRRLEAEGKR